MTRKRPASKASAAPTAAAPSELVEWRSMRLGCLLVWIVAIAGVWLTWRRWLDVLVDFGRELYVPWRLTQGDVLYRDIAWFHGPLSPYFNAAWFWLMGDSLSTLIAVNVVILLLALALVYRMVAILAEPAAALAGGLAFVALFAFGQYIGYANFTWIAPYSHEMTHGVSLALLAIYLQYEHVRSGKAILLVLCGISLGMVFLTKCEVFASAAAALVAGWGALLWQSRKLGDACQRLAIWLLSTLAPIVTAYLLLRTALTHGAALKGVLGGWIYLFDRQLTENLYYRNVLGTDRLLENIRGLLGSAAAHLAVLSLLAVVSMHLGRRGWANRFTGLGAFALAAATVLLLLRVFFDELAKSWPLFVLGCVVVTLARLAKRGASIDVPKAILSLSFSVLAFCLLGRMLLNARVAHYGFVLAMPAAMLLLAAIWTWIPQSLAALGRQSLVYRSGVAGALGAIMLLHVAVSADAYSNKIYPLGRGGDRFFDDSRATYLSDALEQMLPRMERDHTLVVFPEGVMLNYLLRRRNPTPYTNFIPPELAMFGEGRILLALQRSPPDRILLISRRCDEYGYPTFSVDYGKELGSWIRQQYEVTALVGGHPVQEPHYFGVLVMQRKTAAQKEPPR